MNIISLDCVVEADGNLWVVATPAKGNLGLGQEAGPSLPLGSV